MMNNRSSGYGGTIVINSSKVVVPQAAVAIRRLPVHLRPTAVALDYDMGLVRVSTPSTPPVTPAAGSQPSFHHFNHRRNNYATSKGITVISTAPTSPTKVIRSTGSLSSALRGIGATTVTVGSGNSVLKPIPKSSIFTIARKSEKPSIKLNGKNDFSKPEQSPTKLRELLMAQLDLIQRQSEAIVSKDKQLQELRQENRNLVQKLAKFNEEPPRKKARIDSKEKAVETTADLLQGFKVEGQSSPESSYDNILKIRRRRPSNTSRKALELEDDEEEEEIQALMETDTAYFTMQGEEFCENEQQDIKEILHQSECPKWRVVSMLPLSGRQGTEDLKEEIVSKRHDKQEAQEKRRKRWDMQRLRQQRQVEKLKARYDPGLPVSGDGIGSNPVTKVAVSLASKSEGSTAAGNANDGPKSGWIRTFYPQPEHVTHIEVGESLPVSAFGFSLPDLLPTGEQFVNFSVPWLPNKSATKKEAKPKSCDQQKPSISHQKTKA